MYMQSEECSDSHIYHYLKKTEKQVDQVKYVIIFKKLYFHNMFSFKTVKNCCNNSQVNRKNECFV